jgi:hypothetical protein
MFGFGFSVHTTLFKWSDLKDVIWSNEFPDPQGKIPVSLKVFSVLSIREFRPKCLNSFALHAVKIVTDTEFSKIPGIMAQAPQEVNPVST